MSLEPYFYIAKLGYGGLFFAPKHRLWVLARTALPRWFERVPTIYVLSKNKKKINKQSTENFNFYDLRKICILHGRVFVMLSGLRGIFIQVYVCKPKT